MVGATAALTGFVVTVSILIVQMATGTFSARYMRIWQRDRMLHVLLAMLVGTFTFSFAAARAVEEDSVPNLSISATGLLITLDMFLFLVFLDRSVHRLRPVAVAALVAAGTASLRVRRPHYGRARCARAAAGTIRDRGRGDAGRPSPRAGAIQAFDTDGLVRFAREHECTLVLSHTVGDFVPAGATVLRAYGTAALDPSTERRLNSMIALGVERTIEQDPAFAVRIMVDIAIKALSPAVNDPTTAVQVINHLGETLRVIGSTDFQGGREDGDTRSRVLIPARRWEDFLALGVTEIREYGASSIQVVRRLRAMLEELHGAVRPERRAAVEEELARLDADVERTFAGSSDADRATEADHQGLGGPTALERPNVLEGPCGKPRRGLS